MYTREIFKTTVEDEKGF